MANKRQTWGERREKKRKENFIGRREYLEAFSKDFNSDTPEYMVFSVTGEGGVGKSTLLLQFANIASASKGIAVTCDDRQPSPVQAMGHIAAELAKLDITHKEFDERYKKYRELRDEIESDPKAPRGFVDLIARVGADFAIKSGRQIPGLGPLLGEIDTEAAGEAASQALDYLITRWGNKDESTLLRETDRVLTPLFLKLLSEAGEKRRVLLIFDVFERTGATLWPWLLALFNGEYGDLDGNLCFVIAGRDRLEQHSTELADIICHIALEPFTPEETQLYLVNQGITDEKLIHQIHEDTGGLPVLVELLAATKPQPGAPLPDVSKDAVERFLQWIPEEDRRRTALLAAVPRQFNRDIISEALGADATSTFQWLSTQSFIRRNKENGYFYHERIRELMLRHLCQTTPKDLDDTHARLAKTFADEQTRLNLEGEAAYDSESWRNYECERVYHIVSVQPDVHQHEAVNAFMHALRWRWGLAGRIARSLRQCGREKDSKSARELATTLSELYRAFDENDPQSGIECLGALESQNNLTVTSNCEIHLMLGYFCLIIGNPDRALRNFTRATELDEKYARAVAIRGLAYRWMGRYEEALADFTRAIELDDSYDASITARGETYKKMKRYEEALADFTWAIELGKKDATVIANRGDTYRLMERYEEALADLNRAIELDEKDAWKFTLRGATYQEMERYEEALADHNRAIELDEKYAWAIANRGVIYRKLKRYEEALADLTRAIELDEKNAWKVTQRGLTYQEMERYEEALVDFTRAIKLDEKDAWKVALRGETYQEMERYEEALTDLTQAIELDDKYAWAIAIRGMTYFLMERYEEALADFTRAIELGEKDAWVIANRGATYQEMKRYEEAIADHTRAIELGEKDASVIANRGVTYQLMARYEESLADFTRAIELSEKDADVIASRGMSYRLMGQYEEALADFLRAVELDAEKTTAHLSITACYRKLDRMREFRRQVDIVRSIVEKESIYARASFAAVCGDTENALALLRQALESNDVTIESARMDPDFDWIREDPRFVALLDEMSALQNGKESR